MRPPRHTGLALVAAGVVLWRPIRETPADPSGTDGPNGTDETDDADSTEGTGPVEIALVHRPRYGDWSLPKGKVERGETHPAAAVREAAEETGFTAVLGIRLGETRYPVPEGDKVVHYWSGRAGRGEFTPNREVDELRWVTPGSAAELLSYDHDRALVTRFAELGPPPRPVLLVRHAKAGDRRSWSADDDLRPLSGKGHRQAAQLDALLGLFGPTRVYAAPPVRCPQTIAPLADRLGLPITLEPLFGERGYWADPDVGLARLHELVSERGVAVMCSQGGVIPDLVAELTGLSEVPASKASTWVLGFSGDTVVSADYYAEPGAGS